MVYSFFSQLVWLALQCLTPFNKKIKDFVRGRKHVLEDSLTDVIWFHCASVGEFEQARPLIEFIKSENAKEKIVVTFFSPSGYNNFKNYRLADHVSYLPFDTPNQVSKFLNYFRPKVLMLIKYEFWPNLIRLTKKNETPIYSVASIFRKEQRFFGSFGQLFLSDLKKVKHFFVQNEESKTLLSEAGIKDSSVIGDTRFDRVIEIAEKSQTIGPVASFCENSNILVAGSTWLPDEKILELCLLELEGWKFILAPHDVKNSRIQEVKKVFENHSPVVYSGAKSNDFKNAKVLIIDSIGMLNRVYREADLCYVGGAFGAGLHNILEAAVYGKPIIHGPKIDKFKEAEDLLKKGGTFKIENFNTDKNAVLSIFNNPDTRAEMGAIAKEYVYENLGASLKVISRLKQDSIL